MKKLTIITQLVIFFGILIVINLIASKVYFRADFTADQRYTLSSATEDMLTDLDDVIIITAYFTEDLPTQLLATRTDFEDLLIEYENWSGGNVVYEFINPNKSQELENEAQQKGVRPVIVNVTKSDQVKQLRAYMGATIQMNEKTEVIPMIQPGSSMEYSLTTSIKKITLTDKPKIALLQGHGEPSINGVIQLVQQLSVLYDVEPYTINDSTQIPSYFKVIAIIGPQDTIPSRDFLQLDSYLNGNGKLFIAYGNVTGELNQGYLYESAHIGLLSWLANKGVIIGNQFIVDANSASIGVQQQQGPFVINTQVKFPYFPIISSFGDHPASKGLESLLLPLVSPITISSDSLVHTAVLASTSDKTGLMNSPVYIDINKEWTLNDFRDTPQPVAVALEGRIGGATNTKMVVVANGSFIVNGEGQQRQQLNPDNVNFASNAIDWLSDDTGLIDLRTKGITNRPLDQLEDSEKALIKYGNAFGPIFIILIYAFIRKQRNMRKKQAWLQGDY